MGSVRVDHWGTSPWGELPWESTPWDDFLNQLDIAMADVTPRDLVKKFYLWLGPTICKKLGS